jgi:hypothetical protein
MSWPREQGAALVTALLVIVCLSALGLGLVTASSAERQIAGNARGAAALGLAAGAAIEGVIGEIGRAPDWSALLAVATSAFQDGSRQPQTPSRTVVDLDAITTELQADATAAFPLGANTPRWRLFAWGPLTRLAGLAASESRAYVAVWIADDASDADGDAWADANGVIMVHSEAFAGGMRRSADAVLGQALGGVRVLSLRSS